MQSMWAVDVKYSGKVDISVDNIFLFKLFFLGFFSVCLPNIYFNILEYLSSLDLLSFDKSDLKTLCYTKIYSISGTRPLALVVEWGNMHFCCWAQENNSNRGLAYPVIPSKNINK